jgi:hypothetical protein
MLKNMKDKEVKQVLIENKFQRVGEGIKGKGERKWQMYFVFEHGNRTMKPVETVLRKRKKG